MPSCLCLVEGAAGVETEGLELELVLDALVAGPAGVIEGARRGLESVDLLDLGRADVAGVDLAGHRIEGEAEWVAEALGHRPCGIGIGVARERVARERVAGVRV